MSQHTQPTAASIFTAAKINTAFICTLMHAQELALAVNLQRKFAVQLETCQHGIFCDSWLATRNAQHESHRQFACFYTQPSAQTQINAILQHLEALLQEGGQ